jgi:hypothetical protein
MELCGWCGICESLVFLLYEFLLDALGDSDHSFCAVLSS